MVVRVKGGGERKGWWGWGERERGGGGGRGEGVIKRILG